MANSALEARILENGRVHAVKRFVYYFPECFLVVKVADYNRQDDQRSEAARVPHKSAGGRISKHPSLGNQI